MGLDRIKRKLKKDIRKRKRKGPIAKARKALGEVRDTGRRASEWKRRKDSGQRTCIDCGKAIPDNPEKPRCYECWKAWRYES